MGAAKAGHAAPARLADGALSAATAFAPSSGSSYTVNANVTWDADGIGEFVANTMTSFANAAAAAAKSFIRIGQAWTTTINGPGGKTIRALLRDLDGNGPAAVIEAQIVEHSCVDCGEEFATVAERADHDCYRR